MSSGVRASVLSFVASMRPAHAATEDGCAAISARYSSAAVDLSPASNDQSALTAPASQDDRWLNISGSATQALVSARRADDVGGGSMVARRFDDPLAMSGLC